MCGSNFSDYKVIIIFPEFSCIYIVLLHDLIIYFALVVLSLLGSRQVRRVSLTVGLCKDVRIGKDWFLSSQIPCGSDHSVLHVKYVG